VVFVERGQRKITVNYAKRQVGNRVYGGQTSHLPLKLNMSGVIPPIFASSIILFPATLAQWFTSGDTENTVVRCAEGPGRDAVARAAGVHPAVRGGDHVLLLLLHGAGVQQPKETADNLKKSGAFVPGIRPGEQTAKYIDKILMRLTLAGAIYITCGLLLPEFLVLQVERAVLLRRDVAADHRGRHDGLHGPGSGVPDVAPVRKPLKKANFKKAER
jgi:preprotein translocase subunit SecY